MTQTDTPLPRRIPRATRERLVELARGIVRGEQLIVDVDTEPEWETSLMLLADGIIAARNLGLLLVPVAPHMGGYWINGRVPGVTLTCIMVAKGDIPELNRLTRAMHEALHPQV